MRSTSDIFDGEHEDDLPEGPETELTTAEGAPEPAASETPAAETSSEPASDDADEEVVPDNLDGLKRALAAARGDKRKARKQWQETEKQLAQLQGQLTAYQQTQAQAAQPQQPQAQQPVDESVEFWADPLKYTQAILDKRMAAVEEARIQERIQMSAELVREIKPDAAEAFLAFDEAVKTAPHLMQQLRAHPSPAQFAYRVGKEHLARQQYGGSVEEMREKIRAELMAEMKQRPSTDPTPPAPRPQPPRSIAGARGVGAGAIQTWAGPRSTEEIFG